LQWVDDHATVFPRLIEKLSPGGVLAAQMPAYDAVPNRLMREMAATPRWRQWFPDGRAKEWRSHPLEFYYRVLAHTAKWLDLWATDYLQLMPDVDGIVEWYKSTGRGHTWIASKTKVSLRNFSTSIDLAFTLFIQHLKDISADRVS
jgi:trans-aconitate 2-methyltransferase